MVILTMYINTEIRIRQHYLVLVALKRVNNIMMVVKYCKALIICALVSVYRL